MPRGTTAPCPCRPFLRWAFLCSAWAFPLGCCLAPVLIPSGHWGTSGSSMGGWVRGCGVCGAGVGWLGGGCGVLGGPLVLLQHALALAAVAPLKPWGCGVTCGCSGSMGLISPVVLHAGRPVGRVWALRPPVTVSCISRECPYACLISLTSLCWVTSHRTHASSQIGLSYPLYISLYALSTLL